MPEPNIIFFSEPGFLECGSRPLHCRKRVASVRLKRVTHRGEEADSEHALLTLAFFIVRGCPHLPDS